jgi:Fe-S-cluster-containing hydrogenase component 2
MYAFRNARLCTKDCLCLFICPTGATDTETGQIDREKCIDGCRLCVDACPSHAIFLVSERYPERVAPQRELAEALREILARKADFRVRSLVAAEQDSADAEKALFTALAESGKILAEDCCRESGYMVPQQGLWQYLVDSGVMQDRYGEHIEDGDGEALSVLLEKIGEALKEERDADELEARVCERCGHLIIELQGESCPNCGSPLSS